VLVWSVLSRTCRHQSFPYNVYRGLGRLARDPYDKSAFYRSDADVVWLTTRCGLSQRECAGRERSNNNNNNNNIVVVVVTNLG